MLPVLVRVEAEPEALHELVEGALGHLVGRVGAGGGGGILETLQEINYCSFVDVQEELGNSELNLGVSDPVLVEHLFNQKFMNFLLLGLVDDCLILNLRILRYRYIWRHLVPLLIEERVLLLMLGARHTLELLKVALSHFLTHLVLADAAPVLCLARLHAYSPLVLLGTNELHLDFARADHLYGEVALIDLSRSLNRFMDFVAVGTEFATNMHLSRSESTFTVDTCSLCVSMNLMCSNMPVVLNMFRRDIGFPLNSYTSLMNHIEIIFKITIWFDYHLIRPSFYSPIKMFHFHHIINMMHMMIMMMYRVLSFVIYNDADSSSLPILISWSLFLCPCSCCLFINHIKASSSTLRIHHILSNSCFHFSAPHFKISETSSSIPLHECISSHPSYTESIHDSSSRHIRRSTSSIDLPLLLLLYPGSILGSNLIPGDYISASHLSRTSFYIAWLVLFSINYADLSPYRRDIVIKVSRLSACTNALL